MTQLQTLNPHEHRNLGVLTDYLPQLGYQHGSVMVMPNEIQDIQKEYAILFRKHPETGRLFLNALLGFNEKENLFLDGEGNWLADYIPLAVSKGPFLIGFTQDGEHSKPVLSIDMDDPRVVQNAGTLLFTENLDASDYLNQVNQQLAQMHEATPMQNAMIESFNQYELIEPVSIEVELNNGEQINFAGAYTISEEKLAALSADALSKLNQHGFLSAAFYIAGSLGNIKKLISLKNKPGLN